VADPGSADGAQPQDHAVVGCRGTVTYPILGGAFPGEVRVDVRGTAELFIAFADVPLPLGAAILVYASRGHRDVDVMADPYDF
jgi:hypothetical protein